MKIRILAFALTALMMLSLFPVQVFAEAEETTEVYINNQSVEAGTTTITVPVMIKNATAFMAMGLEFEFDTDVFTFTNATMGSALSAVAPSGSVTMGSSGIDINFDNSADATPADGELIVLTFSVKADASAGDYSIVPSVSDNGWFNYDEADVTAEFTGGIITIEAPEATGATFTNGTESFDYETLNADDYTLTAPGEDYYFAGWFKGLESVTTGITNSNGYYVLTGSGVATSTFFKDVIECSPKYDEQPNHGEYHALWVKDDLNAGVMLISVNSAGMTFYKDQEANADTFLTNTLVAVNTTGYVKLLENVTVAQITPADTAGTYYPVRLDANGNTLTLTTKPFYLYNADNVLRSSHGKGSIVSTSMNAAVFLNRSSCTASIYDLSIQAKGQACIYLDRHASLDNLIRCDLHATDMANGLFLKGKSSSPARVGTIDYCLISLDSGTGCAINIDVKNQSINMISNSKIISCSTSAATINCSAGATIVFGAGNTLAGGYQLINGGTIEFKEAEGGTYRIAADSTAPAIASACTLTLPTGYVNLEKIQDEYKVMYFAIGYQATYKDYTGTKTLYVENIAKDGHPSGRYSVSYPNQELTGYVHMGWAEEVNGTVIDDFSSYTSAVTFYAVRQTVNLEAKVIVTDHSTGSTKQYASLDDAFGAFSGTSGNKYTFMLLDDQTVTTTLKLEYKDVGIEIDVNGNTLTVDVLNLIEETQYKTYEGRTITLKSSVAGGKIHGTDLAGCLVFQGEYGANVTVDNLEFTVDPESNMTIVTLAADPQGLVKYTFKNVKAVFADGCAVSVNPVEEAITVGSIAVFLEDTIFETMYSPAIAVASGEEYVVTTLDVNSKFSSPVVINSNPIMGLIAPVTGYTYGDLDGDGPETWYGLILNKPEVSEGAAVSGTDEAPVISNTNNTNVTFKDENLDKRQSLTVNTSAVSMNFLKDALASIAGLIESSADLTFTGMTGVKQGKEKHRITLKLEDADGNKIDFRGAVEVSFPFVGEEGKDYRVYFVDEYGCYAPVDASAYDYSAGTITFTTSHFSDYVVMEASDSYTAGLNTQTPEVSVNGETTVNVGVTFGSESETAFNAAEIVVTYPTDKLQLVTAALDALKTAGTLDYKVTTDAETGLTTLTIEQFGDEKTFGTSVYALTFKALAEGSATVTLTSAAFAHKSDVHASDLQAAIIDPASVELTLVITEVAVDLPDEYSEITGNTVATVGQDYTFTVNKATGYDYTITATVGGVTVPVTDNGNTYTIAGQYVTDDIIISCVKTAQTYTLTWNDTNNAVADKLTTATFGEDITFEILPDQAASGTTAGWIYSVSAVLTGTETAVPVSKNGTTCTILAANVTGPITITVTKTTQEAPQVTVTVTGSNEIYQGENQITTLVVDKNSEVTLSLNAAEGYSYVIKANNEVVTLNENNQFTVQIGQDDVEITVVKTLDGTVSVYDYLTVGEGQKMYLITYTNDLASGYVPMYGADHQMLWSEKYQAYCWLVISNAKPEAADAKASVSVVAGTKAVVDYSHDVNGTGRVDAADAQFVYNMYKAEYSNFDQVGVAKFLAADQNATYVAAQGETPASLNNVGITVADATVIINAIIAGIAA